MTGADVRDSSGPGSGAVLARAAARCAAVAAVGTDPSRLALVLAWCVRPRRSPDGLRRACRDLADSSDAAGGDAIVELASRVVSAADLEASAPLVEAWRHDDVRVAVVGDPAYPGALAEGWPHTDGPPLLAVRGGGPTAEPPEAAVAIVGSRRASGYGSGVAAWLADAAARAGVEVVSGGAVGIDGAAHRGALDADGRTSVVLGCGHAVRYPRPHARDGGLFDRILAAGGRLVSELLPHEPPRAHHVRARNRLVAALADVVVVVEGGARSGALLTASAAADRGRTVLAVPGDVRAPGSVAPHRLLAEGAGPCTGPDDLLAALDVTAAAQASAEAVPRSLLPRAVHAALVVAWPRPLRFDQLAAASRTPVPALLAAVTRAQVAGEVANGPEGVRLRRAPTSMMARTPPA